jgi:hypothetical protein
MARTLTITETNINWVHPGLSHNTANLVCGVGTAIALRATTLRMRPFWDPPALTGCKRAARVQFERLYAFDELKERFGLTVETLPWDTNSRVPAYAISESRKNDSCPGASVVERAAEKPQRVERLVPRRPTAQVDQQLLPILCVQAHGAVACGAQFDPTGRAALFERI